jgi:4-amino-4-deoxy-L-arabinose transferase-like glycosyltransferase
MTPSAPPPRPGTSLIVAAGTLLLMLATGPRLAIVWDETYTLGRVARVRDWFQALRDPAQFAATWRPPAPGSELVQPDGRPAPRADEIDTRAKLFEARTLEWFWPFAREEPHGHPPFYALVALIGDVLAPLWPPLPRARLGPMILFSLTTGALFGAVGWRWGVWPGIAAAGAWLLQPRLFAHGHYALYDGVLTSLWVGSILAFARAVEPREGRRGPRWGWVIAFGVLAGWAADTKLTGWFLPLPLLAWTAFYRDRRGAMTLALGALVALATLYAFNPPWWLAPIGGIDRFLRSNLGRARTIPIATMFLGRVIQTPKDSLPWYNTLVWTGFITPVGVLSLALIGAFKAIRDRRSERFGPLVLGHWTFLLVLRALPHTPGHDAERQFLAAFGCLAPLAGIGAAWLLERFGRWARWLIVAALAEAAISIGLMMPVPLSYYSPLVGGLPGATNLGMEPTYYWDALGTDALDWIDRHTEPGEKALIRNYPALWLRQVGRLTGKTLPTDPGTWKWYVVQNRPGSFGPLERALVKSAGPERVLVAKWGVPLVYVFPMTEVERIRAEY